MHVNFDKLRGTQYEIFVGKSVATSSTQFHVFSSLWIEK